MSNNLFVSFQLADPQHSSALVLAGVEELGHSMPLFRSVWYVRSNLSAVEAAARLRDVLDGRDRLIVVDATNNEVAMMNVDERACAILDVQWHREIAMGPCSPEVPAVFREERRERACACSVESGRGAALQGTRRRPSRVDLNQ